MKSGNTPCLAFNTVRVFFSPEEDTHSVESLARRFLTLHFILLLLYNWDVSFRSGNEYVRFAAPFSYIIRVQKLRNTNHKSYKAVIDSFEPRGG